MYFFNLDLGESTLTEVPINLEQLADLDKRFDPEPWAHKTWMELPKDDFEAVFRLSKDAEILGMAVFRLSFQEGLAHLIKFLIIPDRRREGLGELLLLRAIEILKSKKLIKVYLEVEKGNPAFFLYQKLGLKKVHEIADFYGPGRSRLVMISNQ